MTEIEVCLCPVFRDENFAVLVRAHRTWVDVQVWVKFYYRGSQPASSQKPAQ